MISIGAITALMGIALYALEGVRVPRRPRGGTPVEIASLVAVAIGSALCIVGIWEGVLGFE